MSTINIQKMKSDELRNLADAIAEELQRREQQDQQKTAARIKALAASAGLKVVVAPAGRTAGKSPVRYRHPDDPSKTWPGRGKRPRWLNEWLKQGKPLEATRIQ